jgi:hypothetical protein
MLARLVPSSSPYFTQQEALVLLDRQQVKRFEDAQAGNNAHFLARSR